MESAKATISIDQDMIAARRTADQITYLLDRFIPDACRREARDWVVEVCYKEGFELTTKLMRKEYEAWKQLQIDSLGPSSLFSKPE